MLPRLTLLALLACVACAPALPPYEVVGGQGVFRFLVVSPALVADDAALWRIADHLRQDTPGQTIQAMFWTDPRAAWRSIDLEHPGTPAVVTVNVNPFTGHRSLTRAGRP